MTRNQDDEEGRGPAYAQNPRPSGMRVSYRIEGRTLVVDTGRKLDRVQLGAVEEVRLTFEPRSFAQSLFRTRLKLVDGKTLTFSSVSYKGLLDVERQDAEYGAFVRALTAAIARENPKARWLAGKPAFVWYGTVVAAAVTLLAVALFAWRAFTSDALAAAIMGLVVGGFGIWQLEPIVRLNRPRSFSPDNPPRDLAP